tara:strand:- start:365 stop:649 length:285 start_codon:yes stop_codon:yes gene_type:complete
MMKKGEKFAMFMMLMNNFLEWKFKNIMPPGLHPDDLEDIVKAMYDLSMRTKLMTKKDLDDSTEFARKQRDLKLEEEKIVRLDVARLRKKKPSIH